MTGGNPLGHIAPHVQAALALPVPASISEIFAALVGHNAIIADYEPIDKEGFWITPRAPTTAAALEVVITPVLAQGNWIVTSLKDGRVLVEPRHTRLIQVAPPGSVYHVTTRDRRTSIRQNGLEPRQGGNTRMQRRYPPRTFFALNLLAAFEFVDFQCRRNMPIMRPGNRPDGIDPDLLRNTDIWRVRLPEGVWLRHDILFSGKAGWIEQMIPPRDLSLAWPWQFARHAWHFLREHGWV